MSGNGGVAISFAKAKHHFEACVFTEVGADVASKVEPLPNFPAMAADQLEFLKLKSPLLGARVLVGGLAEKVHFNGMYGTAVDFSYQSKHPFPAGGQWDTASGRYEVELDGPEKKRILVKPEKVTRVEPAGAASRQDSAVSHQFGPDLAGDGGGREGEQGGGGKRRKTSSTI